VSDGFGGAIVIWSDFRNGLGYRTFGQRIDGAGLVQWTPDGKDLFAAFANPGGPSMVADGSGGAIIVFEALQTSLTADIYAHRIDGAGNLQWGADGIVVCGAAGDQMSPRIVSNQSGGVIIGWVDYRRGGLSDLYAQRLNSSGVLQWASDGVPVGILTGGLGDWAMTSDGAGGSVIVWDDWRLGTETQTYAQGITPGPLP
jgi:hypothetical protein